MDKAIVELFLEVGQSQDVADWAMGECGRRIGREVEDMARSGFDPDQLQQRYWEAMRRVLVGYSTSSNPQNDRSRAPNFSDLIQRAIGSESAAIFRERQNPVVGGNTKGKQKVSARPAPEDPVDHEIAAALRRSPRVLQEVADILSRHGYVPSAPPSDGEVADDAVGTEMP